MRARRLLLPLALGMVVFMGRGDAASPPQAGCEQAVCHQCKLVPEVRQIKKTVYEVQEVPYCLHKLPPLFGHYRGACPPCPECDCPRYKKVLIKKEVVCEEVCGTKCVVEAGAKCTSRDQTWSRSP